MILNGENLSRGETEPQQWGVLSRTFKMCLCDSQSNDLQRALDWIFSNMNDLESMDISEGGRSAAESESASEPPPGPRVRDGPGSKSSSDGPDAALLSRL